MGTGHQAKDDQGGRLTGFQVLLELFKGNFPTSLELENSTRKTGGLGASNHLLWPHGKASGSTLIKDSLGVSQPGSNCDSAFSLLCGLGPYA